MIVPEHHRRFLSGRRFSSDYCMQSASQVRPGCEACILEIAGLSMSSSRASSIPSEERRVPIPQVPDTRITCPGIVFLAQSIITHLFLIHVLDSRCPLQVPRILRGHILGAKYPPEIYIL